MNNNNVEEEDSVTIIKWERNTGRQPKEDPGPRGRRREGRKRAEYIGLQMFRGGDSSEEGETL